MVRLPLEVEKADIQEIAVKALRSLNIQYHERVKPHNA